MKAKKHKKSNPATIDTYEAAFLEFIGSKSVNFEMQEYYLNGTKLVLYNEKVYKIDSIQGMTNHFREILTNKELAMNIPVMFWIAVAEFVHLRPDFIEKLIQTLIGTEEFENLNLAINLSNHASKSPYIFWITLDQLDPVELYPKAIMAACEIYDLDGVINELMDFMTAEGNTIYNQLEDGIFEIIDLDEDEKFPDIDSLFYISDLPLSWWETNN